LLSPRISTETFTEASLRAVLKTRFQDMASPFSLISKKWLSADPTGESMAIVQSWRPEHVPEKYSGEWFSADHKQALLIAETKVSGFELDDQENIQSRIYSIFEKVNASIAPAENVRLIVSGPAVFAVNSRRVIKSEVQIISLTASLLIAAILLIAYRALRLAVISSLPLMTAILAGAVTVGLLFGSIHGITLAFGITLLGVTIDYPIHVYSHLRQGQKPLETLQRIWPTIRLGVATSSVGYIAMASTDMLGLAQLGIFALAGLFAAASFTRFMLPAFLGDYTENMKAHIRTDRLNILLQPKRNIVIFAVITGIGSFLLLITVFPPVWEHDLSRLSPIPIADIQFDQSLRKELAVPEAQHIIMIEASDVEQVLQQTEQVTSHLQAIKESGVISGFQTPTRYVPSIKSQLNRQSAIPSREQLAHALKRAQSGLPFKEGIFIPFLDAVDHARTQSPITAEKFLETNIGERLSSLLRPISDGWQVRIVLAGLTDENTLMKELDNLAMKNVVYLNMKRETDRLMTTYRDEAFLRLAWGSVFIVLILWLGSRNLKSVIAVLVPVSLALFVDLLLLTVIGESLSLFHLVSLLLVLGIGLDYSLFFSRPDKEVNQRIQTLHGVIICASSTVVVFGMLGFSTIPVLHAIGITVSIGVTAAFVLSMVISQYGRHY